MMPRLPVIIRVVLATAFVLSAVTKMLPIEVFEKTLVLAGLATWNTVPVLSRLIVAVECGLGLCLLQKNGLRTVIFPATALLLLFFSGYLIVQGRQTGFSTGNCGCFGEWIPMSPLAALIKNGVLFMLTSVAFASTPQTEKSRWKIPAGLFLVALVAVFSILRPQAYWAATIETHGGLPTDPLTAFTSFVGTGTVDLTKGRVLVALFALDCEDCMEVAGKVGHLGKQSDLPPLYALFLGDSSEVSHFFEVAGTTFPYRILEPMTFFPLLDEAPAPPRVVYLQDGRVRGEWHYSTFREDAFLKTVIEHR